MSRSMQIILGFIGVAFVILALLHVPHPSPYLWVPYAAGGVLSFLALFPAVNVMLARILAVATAGLLFFFFSGFFLQVPELKAGWYERQEAWVAISMLFGAFSMLPVLSHYSCRCKAECRERVSERDSSFFSAPADATHGQS